MTSPADPVAARSLKPFGARLSLLFLPVLLLAVPGAMAQSGPVAAGEVARAGYSVQMGVAPAPGGEGVLTLAGPVNAGAVLQWQRKGAGESAFVNVFESPTYSGATASTLRVSAATAAMNGDQFRCLVMDASGTTVSAPATLVVGAPLMGIVDGNHQTTEVGRFNARPFDVAVWDAAGIQPLVDTPVTFTVQSGGGQLALSSVGTAPLASSLTLKTDADGTVQAFYRHAAIPNTMSKIKAVAGTREVIFETTSLAAGADDAFATRSDASGNTRSNAAGKGRVAMNAASLRGLAMLDRGANGREPHNPALDHAETVGSQLILRTRPNEYYSVTISSWAIASAQPP